MQSSAGVDEFSFIPQSPFQYFEKSVQLGLVDPPAAPSFDGLDSSESDVLQIRRLRNLKILDSLTGC